MSKFMTLLVEDDPLQREVLAEVLRDNGYEVVECATAEAAELIVSTSGNELQALVTDHNLQGHMTGAELAHFTRIRFPDVVVIVMSGKPAPQLPIGAHFLLKPCEPITVLNTINQNS